jgi:hypothetical protein
MTNRILSAAIALSLGCTVATLSAQRAGATVPPTNVTVKGCVAEATGHYLLNRALVVRPVAEAPAPTATGAPTPPAAKADDQVYELVGAQVAPHVGHQVQVTGTMVPSSTPTGGGMDGNDLKQAAHPMAGTVTVKSIKMIASTCQ